MARQQHLPENLSPAQVIALQDALLANAERLLRASRTMLGMENISLARSLAILGMEESGKAIALHERRVGMACAPEGEPFVDERLRNLWAQHAIKLEAVHNFLLREDYWFDTQPPEPEESLRVLGTIQDWKNRHNALKQRGFYVDVTPEGDPITPEDTADAEIVLEVLSHVHQIGWQLRLGEHIEGKRRLQLEQDDPPAANDEIEATLRLLPQATPEFVERFIESLREGTKGVKFNNAAYVFHLPANPFENLGRPGYEAQDRELWKLVEESAEAEAPKSDPDD